MYSRVGPGPSGPSPQDMPESTSEDGTASRRPSLPSANQANSAGGGPSCSTAISIMRRIRASKTTEMIELI